MGAPRAGHAQGERSCNSRMKELPGISGVQVQTVDRTPECRQDSPYPAALGFESRRDAEVRGGRPWSRQSQLGQWHDGRRAAPSLDQTVRGVAPRLFAPLVVSQGCTITSRLCISLAAGYRALSSSNAYRPGVYLQLAAVLGHRQLSSQALRACWTAGLDSPVEGSHSTNSGGVGEANSLASSSTMR